MKNIVTASLFFLAAGIFTSVSILSAYQILFALSVAYYTYLAIKDNQFRLPKSAWFLLAFTVVATISLIINLDVIPKPSKNFGRLKYYIFGVSGIIVLNYWLKESSDKIKRNLTSLFLISIIVAALYATIKFFINGEDRADGFTDTLRYGYGTGMILLVLLSSILHSEKTKVWCNPKLGIAAFITGFIALYFTYTRGALLGFMCGLPFALYYYRVRIGLTLGAMAGVGVLALVCFYLFGSGNYNSRFLVNKNNKSDYIRRSQWQAAIIATQEKPILGWGLSNFHSQLERIKKQNNLDAQFYNDAHAHNLFLEVAAGTGLIGLFLFIGWVISWGWEVFKQGGLVRACILPFGIAFISSSQFEVTFDANNVSMIFFLYSMSCCYNNFYQDQHDLQSKL